MHIDLPAAAQHLVHAAQAAAPVLSCMSAGVSVWAAVRRWLNGTQN
jgi:hypothetical protein